MARGNRSTLQPTCPAWVLRDVLGLTGTKFGCGIAQCGACTVHIDGKPVRSCVMPVGAVRDRTITNDRRHRRLARWGKGAKGLARSRGDPVGYCQSGQIMSAAALLATTPIR